MNTPTPSSARPPRAASAADAGPARSASGQPRTHALKLTEAEIELLRREFAASPAWRDIFRVEPVIAA